MFDRIILICFAVFFLLFGLLAVTNIKVEWGPVLMGFAALIVGVVCTVKAVRS